MAKKKVKEKEKEKDKDKGIAPACRGCIRWNHFGKKCWYYWENKKQCSMYTTNVEDL